MINSTDKTLNQPILIMAQEIEDLPEILQLHEMAFKQPAEAHLVETLSRQTNFNTELSRVAKINNKIIGHILFTEIHVDNNTLPLIAALAPMAVLPEHQGQGVGGALIDESFLLLAKENFAGVVVLGDKGYYGRYGCTHDIVAHIASPYQCENYMGYEFLENTFSNITEIRYPSAFMALDSKEDEAIK